MLEKINSPQDLKNLSLKELELLADDIREFLISSVTKTGGHLASNLGVVELTIALHYIFNAPDDSIIWDVSHQAYVHKILTNRKDKMPTIRQKGGLSGFSKISESKYDSFGCGHSSTSISAALGIAVANKLKENNNKSIAVIGDGALTGGMAFEALNNLEELNSDVLIIVNDNEMSISKNVGGLSKHLAKLIAGKFYGTMKDTSMKILDKTPTLKEFAKKSEEHFKGMFLPSSFFESLGIEYFGPIDGHNLKDLTHILGNLKNKTNPRVLHITTTKGNGYPDAEENPLAFHGISPNNSQKSSISYSKVFGKWLMANGENDKLLAITPAMCEGSGMSEFADSYPNKFFDTGITEQHAITFAAGLATQGFKPIVAIYSTFLQRGYDQLIHDVALQNLGVIFAIDRAGIVGSDGPTHNGSFDLSFLLPIPNLVIATPSCGDDLYKLLNTAMVSQQTFCIRYPRDNTTLSPSSEELPIGKAEIKKQGSDVAILVFGTLLNAAQIAANEINATVVNMLFVKPLDENMIIDIAKNHQYIITLEENTAVGGAGEQVLSVLNKYNLQNKIKMMGLPDEFSEHASIQEVHQDLGLNCAGIIKTYEELKAN
jgi:1-deoxy-D-xylulose-5-phosphate synthase